MRTIVAKISSAEPELEIITSAAEVLRSGGLVAFPTETVYGLGADAYNPGAVAKVFKAKGRPTDNPLIVHIASIEQLYELGKSISSTAERLAREFWPGPLTLVVRRHNIVPDIVTANLETVAVRMPNHAVPLALVKNLQKPIVGPSANLSGRPSPTLAQHVYDDLNGIIEMILDAGPTIIGVESTVVDTTTTPPTILRLGGLTIEQLSEVLGNIHTAKSIEALRRSPGTRHRHYAPQAKVILIPEGNTDEAIHLTNLYTMQGKKVGAIFHSIQRTEFSQNKFFCYLPSDIQTISRQIFNALRTLDSQGVDVILVETVSEKGLGAAVMDRLRRAADKMPLPDPEHTKE